MSNQISLDTATDQRTRKQRREDNIREIVVKLRKTGMSWTKIAKLLGITKKQAMAKGRSARNAVPNTP